MTGLANLNYSAQEGSDSSAVELRLVKVVVSSLDPEVILQLLQ
jgi:hypothetical protein